MSQAPYAPSLQRFRRYNQFSGNGEDGIIAELCRRLNISSGWFCEFGAWDGRYGSNCYALLRAGWRGVMIEGDAERCVALRRLAARWPGLVALEAFVSQDRSSERSLDRLLEKTPIPRDFEVLSIDIDGFDYQVWESIATYRPLIVVIEIDSSVPPGLERVADGCATTTFSAMLKLGLRKGYRLVAHTGNMVFVREDCIASLGMPQHELAHPETLFSDERIGETLPRRIRRKLRFLTPQRAWVKLVNRVRGFWPTRASQTAG